MGYKYRCTLNFCKLHCCGLICLKIGITQQLLAKELKKKLSDGLGTV